MSISVDYFFNSDLELRELAKAVNGCLGSNLMPYNGDSEDFFDRFLSMELNLSRAEGFENDLELNFEDYKYQIGIRVPTPDADIRDLQVGVVGMIAALLYRRLNISDGMVVYDIQKLLARYEERIRDNNIPSLFDVVSQRLVEFPEHFSGLYQ